MGYPILFLSVFLTKMVESFIISVVSFRNVTKNRLIFFPDKVLVRNDDDDSDNEEEEGMS